MRRRRGGSRALDRLEAEIRETRARLGLLLVRADREFGLRAGLHGMLRLAAKSLGGTAAQPGKPGALALPAAIIAFAVGVIGARRAAPPETPADPTPPASEAPAADTDC